MTTERTFYRERTSWPGWVRALFVTAIVVSCYPLLAGWDTKLPFVERLLIVALIGGFAGVVRVLLSGMTVLVQESRVLIHMGLFPMVRKSIPFADIISMSAVRYRPIRDYGGWGIRGYGRRRAWTVRGNRGVALELVPDREFLIGSDHPMRLAERIRTAMGETGARDLS